MSTVEPTEQLSRDIDALVGRIRDLHSEVRLADVRDGIEDLTTSVNNLLTAIKDTRARGYAFGKEMEGKATSLAQQWATMQPSVVSRLEQEAYGLQGAIGPIEAQMAQVQAYRSLPYQARPLYAGLDNAVKSVKNRADAAKRNVQGMYDSFQQQVNTLKSELDRINWMLKQLGEASFQLLAKEGAIRAVKATWVQGGKEDSADPQGVLYLTDQRLIFEQKQDVATKKVLFITTAKERVQKLLLEVPVALIRQAQAKKQGLMGHEDHVYLTFEPQAPQQLAQFHIDGQDCNEWQSLIGRARSRDFDQDRAVAVDQAQVEKVKSAPTECPNCGGKLDGTILRGMDTITCGYCGKVIRL